MRQMMPRTPNSFRLERFSRMVPAIVLRFNGEIQSNRRSQNRNDLMIVVMMVNKMPSRSRQVREKALFLATLAKDCLYTSFTGN